MWVGILIIGPDLANPNAAELIDRDNPTGMPFPVFLPYPSTPGTHYDIELERTPF